MCCSHNWKGVLWCAVLPRLTCIRCCLECCIVLEWANFHILHATPPPVQQGYVPNKHTSLNSYIPLQPTILIPTIINTPNTSPLQ